MDNEAAMPLDPMVMAQQIQALTANVQELMRQNEELKRQAHLKGSNTSHHRRSHSEEASSPGKQGKRCNRVYWTVYTRQRLCDAKPAKRA
nr:hypothetical protein CFP56_65375 [Quercus suber]